MGQPNVAQARRRSIVLQRRLTEREEGQGRGLFLEEEERPQPRKERKRAKNNEEQETVDHSSENAMLKR